MTLPTTGLPDTIVERIKTEVDENDAIYRKRSVSLVDLSALHYGHARMLEWAFRQFSPCLVGRRILDVGVGDGYSSVLLARRGARVTGIDVSSEALRRAATLTARNHATIDLRQMAGEHLDFEDATFDGVLSISAFHHMDLAKAAGEFARVLRPGGRAVFVEPLASNPPAWIYRRLIGWRHRSATSQERQLRVRDIAILKTHFRQVRWRGMFFLTLPLFALDRIWDNRNPFVHRITELAFDGLFPVDELLAAIPLLGRLAWKLCVVAER